MNSPKERGIKAENYFISLLNNKGIQYNYDDDWYDFEVMDNLIEVKSCNVSVKQSGSYRVGRFDFTDEENREMQYKENIWICFIIQASNQFICLGFCRARKLQRKRYISCSKYRELDLISFEDWLNNV